MNINLVILSGRVGQEVSIRQFVNGKQASFTLATTTHYKKDGDWQKKTEWHSIIAYNDVADKAEKYITKGTGISIVGSINYSSWEDANGQKHYKTDIVASKIDLLDKLKASEQQPQPAQQSQSAQIFPGQPVQEEEADDLPF